MLLSESLHAGVQPSPANNPGWKSEHAAKIVIGIVLQRRRVRLLILANLAN